jgi:hypothetical protein
MAPQPEDQQTVARYKVTMGGSEWSVAKYGIVEFLRAHPFFRALVAILGVASGLLYIGTFVGLKFPGNISGFVFFFLSPTLLWLATVAGPSFQLTFPAAQAEKERQTAEKQFEESKSPEDALRLDFTRLNEYYIINQTQARSSFRWAIFSMFIGLGTIVGGIWLFYFRTSQPDTFMASLSTAAGCVVNIISGLFLYLHSKTQERSFRYYEQLARLQRLTLAMRLVDRHENPDKQADARNRVIHQLLEQSADQSLAPISDGVGGNDLRLTPSSSTLKSD